VVESFPRIFFSSQLIAILGFLTCIDSERVVIKYVDYCILLILVISFGLSIAIELYLKDRCVRRKIRRCLGRSHIRLRLLINYPCF
jgi:hypothetical protein